MCTENRSRGQNKTRSSFKAAAANGGQTSPEAACCRPCDGGGEPPGMVDGSSSPTKS